MTRVPTRSVNCTISLCTNISASSFAGSPAHPKDHDQLFSAAAWNAPSSRPSATSDSHLSLNVTTGRQRVENDRNESAHESAEPQNADLFPQRTRHSRTRCEKTQTVLIKKYTRRQMQTYVRRSGFFFGNFPANFSFISSSFLCCVRADYTSISCLVSSYIHQRVALQFSCD